MEMNYYPDATPQVKKFCPSVMCPDNYVQDPRTCQCRPVAQTVPSKLVEDLSRFGGLINEMCNTVPQIMKEGICNPYYRRDDA